MRLSADVSEVCVSDLCSHGSALAFAACKTVREFVWFDGFCLWWLVVWGVVLVAPDSGSVLYFVMVTSVACWFLVDRRFLFRF